MIYPPNQKPPIWSIDPGIIAHNCQKAGMPHPVLAMPFWERAGDQALDYSGRGNHGIIDGADWVANGIKFVSANTDKITTSLYIDPRKANTIIFKTTWTTLSSDNLHGCRNVGGDRFYVGIDSAYVFMGAGDSFHYAANGIPHGMSADVPYTISLIIDGSTAKYYVDSVQKDSLLYSASAAITNPFVIGDLGGVPGFSVNAMVEFMYVYDCALSVAQIKFLRDNPYFMYEIPEELYGYVAAVGGWTGEIIGITNPTEIMGRATSEISEVMGVS